MRVLIAGAGRLGRQMTLALSAEGNEVTLVDSDDELVAKLQGQLPARVLYGDACDPAVLEEAGALKADVLVAATGDDEDNLVISLLARRQFAVPRNIARINYAENDWLFDQQWGVDVAVSASNALVALVQEATGSPDTVGLLRLSSAGVNVAETRLGRRSASVGRSLGEVRLPPGSVVAAVIRAGVPSVPDSSFRLQAGDELLVISETANATEIDEAFQRRSE